LLFPLVSISVAIILFEGGLSLRIMDLRQVGTVFFSLITVGLLITWFLITFAAYFIVGLDFPLALLLGAMLVVKAGPPERLGRSDYQMGRDSQRPPGGYSRCIDF